MHKILFRGKDEGHFTALLSLSFILIFSILFCFSTIVQMQYRKLENEKNDFISFIESNNEAERVYHETH